MNKHLNKTIRALYQLLAKNETTFHCKTTLSINRLMYSIQRPTTITKIADCDTRKAVGSIPGRAKANTHKKQQDN